MTPTSTTKVTPYLACADASSAIAFYQQAFGAVEVARIPDEQGRVSHAEIRIDGAPVFISDEYPEIGVRSPQSIGGSPVMVVLSVPDVDAVFHRAVAAGAAVDRPLQDGFGGALRTAKITDPFGHRWMILTEKSRP